MENRVVAIEASWISCSQKLKRQLFFFVGRLWKVSLGLSRCSLDFMECGCTVNAEFHCETEMLKSGVHHRCPGIMAEDMVARVWIISSHRSTIILIGELIIVENSTDVCLQCCIISYTLDGCSQ